MVFDQKDTKGRRDWLMDVALGKVPGVTSHFMSGKQNDLDSADGELTIWDNKSNVSILSSSAELFVSSSVSSDTSTVVSVSGFDNDFEATAGVATLSGHTQVSVGTFRRVETAIVTANTPTGDVYIAESDTLTNGVPDTGSKIQGKIPAGENITHNGLIHVPANRIAVITSLRMAVDVTNKNAQLHIYFHHPDRPTLKTANFAFGGGGGQFSFDVPVATSKTLVGTSPTIDEKTTIEHRATTDANNTVVTVGAEYLLVDRSHAV